MEAERKIIIKYIALLIVLSAVSTPIILMAMESGSADKGKITEQVVFYVH